VGGGKDNGFKRAVVTFVAVFLLLVLAAPAGARTASTPASFLLTAINGTRAGHGLGPVRIDVRLVRAARSHSADMLRRDYFAGPGFRRVGIGIATGTFHGYGGATVVTADFAGT
jgi:hypothetical protein